MSKYHSKLTEAQLQEIKQLLMDERGIRQVWIASRFGVNQSCIAYHKKRMQKSEFFLPNTVKGS